VPEDTPDIRINTDEPARSVATAPRARLRRVLALLVGLALCAAIAWIVWFWPKPEPATRARGARPDAIPVLVATATRQDVPIWLDGLGTVQASATVTVKPRIDGQLTEVRFREGQDVAEGEVLARIDARPYQAALDQAVAKKAQDEAQLANARIDAARYARLVQNNFASAQQADTARALVAQLEAQVAQDQAQIDTAQTNLSFTTISAPIAGRTGMRLLDQGNIAHASDTTGLVVITALQPVAVVFTLPQQSLPAIAAAMKAGSPEVVALTQANTATGTVRELDRGQLTVLDNQVDPATGTIRLKAIFPNAARLLWPGGFVNVRIRVATQNGALTVPPAAIQRGPRGTFAYVVTDENTAQRRTVSVGHEDQAVSVVTDGLKPGDRVVTDGASRLAENMKVAIVEPEPPRTGPPPAAAPGARRRGQRGG